MPPESPISGLAHIIQLAVAPVFLLSGVGMFLAVLTSRLARIIDRTRALEAARTAATGVDDAAIRAELRVLPARARLINRAIGLNTYSALLVAGVIAALFLGAFVRLDLSTVVAVAFVAAMLTLIAGLLAFLQEVHLGIRWMRQTSEPRERSRSGDAADKR